MAPARRYLERDLFELGYTAQCLAERAHSFWFWANVEGEDCDLPGVLCELVEEMTADLRYLMGQDLGEDFRRLGKEAEFRLATALAVYRQRWMCPERRQLLRSIDRAGGILPPEVEETESPLAQSEWIVYRQALKTVFAALPGCLSVWPEVGGLMAQVLSLGDTREQAQILGEILPIPRLRDVLGTVHDAYPDLSDVGVDFSDQSGYKDVESVQREVKRARKVILDRLASVISAAASPSTDVEQGPGKAGDSAKLPTDQDDASHTESDAIVYGGTRTSTEAELPYELIPPVGFSWRGGPRLELPPQQWQLLAYCLENRNIEVQDVYDHLWGEDSSDKSESALDSPMSKLNTRLLKSKIPISLSRKAGRLILSING